MRTPPLELAAPVRLPSRRVQAVVQLPLAVRLPSVAAPGPLEQRQPAWLGGRLWRRLDGQAQPQLHWQ